MKKRFLLLGILGVLLIGFFFGVYRTGIYKKLALFNATQQTQNAVIIPDLQDGIKLEGVTSVAFSGNDAFFAAGLDEGSLFIWDIGRGRRIRAIRAGSHAVTSVAFGNDTLASACRDEISVWNFFPNETGEAQAARIFTFDAGTTVHALAFNGDGTELFALCKDNIVKCWNIAAGKPSSSAPAHDTVFYYEFSQNKGGLDYWSVNGRGEKANKEQLTTPVTEKISALAVNGGKTRMLAGTGSGIIILINMSGGAEIARYLNFGNAEDGEWISLVPQGFYNASANGDSLMKVESGGESVSMAQFSNALFRPDLQAQAIREGGPISAEDSLQALLSPEYVPPNVEILGAKSISVNDDKAQIKVKITVNSGGMGRLKVVNGSTLVGYLALNSVLQKEYSEKDKTVYEAAITVPLERGKNRIGVSVFGERRKRESDPAHIEITASWEQQGGGKPVLHVMLMSIEKYKNAGTGGIGNLRFTHDDADAISELFTRQKRGSLYRDVIIHKYADDEVTKEGFQKAFGELSNAVKREDCFVFFYAGHGFVDKSSGDFFFIPYDSVGFFDNPMEDNIVMDDIVSGITSVHAKNSFVLLDTCQSGTLLESGDTAFEKLIRQLGQKAIITATMGNQDAIESASIGHGIFTMSLLDSYDYLLENQFSTAADIIAFTKTDVPNKFTALMESARRGLLVITPPETQKPMAHMPKNDFEVFDRYTEPGTVEIRSITAGKITIFGLPSENTSIRANGTVEKRLNAGSYKVSIEYADNHLETKEVTVSNVPQSAKFKARKEVVSFDYRVAARQSRPAPDGFVWIQGGTFTMGSPANDPSRYSNEGPQHQVTVSSFYMGKYEVTQKEYQEVMGTNPSNFKGDNLPVENVSWYDAIEYCNKRSQKEGLTPAYIRNGNNVTWNRNANGYRLPTEAEWEYACRAGTTTAYNTGAKISDNTGWYWDNSGRKTHPVGQKPSNAWGLYDMHGNVFEWCWDWHGGYSSGSQTDPMGASSGAFRVGRGGGWSASDMRSAFRSYNYPDYRYSNLGFRLVRP